MEEGDSVNCKACDVKDERLAKLDQRCSSLDNQVHHLEWWLRKYESCFVIKLLRRFGWTKRRV